MRIAEPGYFASSDVEDRLVGKRGHPPAFGFQPVSRKVGNGPNKLRLEGECQTAASFSIPDQGLQAITGDSSRRRLSLPGLAPVAADNPSAMQEY